LLLVAAGTGISQAHSLLDAQQPQDPSATLLWCVSSPADKQTQDLLILSQSRYATNIVVDDRQGSANKGVRWLVERMNSFGLHRKILCGPPGFVYAVVDALEQAGFDASDIEADAFSYAPRPAP
jgi:CDP-4-dehydro-6-deoxyglucose reductase